MLILVRKKTPKLLQSLNAIRADETFRNLNQSLQLCDLNQNIAEWQHNSAERNSSNYQFRLSHYFMHLNASQLGSVVFYSHAMESTQAFMKRMSKFMPSGAVCIADNQALGRGRGTNKWECPPGSLTFTFKTSVATKDSLKLPLFQYIACLALIKGIKGLNSEIDVKIKWPNDIYALSDSQSIKIGGILCESFNESGSFTVLIGIGLNVDNSEPTTCLNNLLTGGETIDRETVLASFFNVYEQLEKRLLSDGFQSLRREYLENWLHTDQEVHLQSESNLRVKIKTVSLETGALIAEAESGQKFELFPDGNRLDFFNGLLSRKVTDTIYKT